MDDDISLRPVGFGRDNQLNVDQVQVEFDINQDDIYISPRNILPNLDNNNNKDLNNNQGNNN